MAKLEPQISPDYDFAESAVGSNQFTFETDRSILTALSLTPCLRCWRYRYIKRFADIVISCMVVTVVVVPALLIAAAIAFSSDGPVFYTETRIGQGGRPFRIWKFRTMCRKAELREVLKVTDQTGSLLHWRVHKCPSDPRITPVGRILRGWSLDELPQIINVLLGHMSLVGPRPVVAAEVPLYGHLQQHYLAAVPGLSGLWQISGRNKISFARRAAMDAIYVQNWSLKGDVAILLKTIPAVLSRVGAH